MTKSNKCTLLIDGNWFMMSRLFAEPGRFDEQLSEARLSWAQEELKNSLAKSVNIILHKMPFVDNIILVTDGGSWRKQLQIPKVLRDITYKGNREGQANQTNISWKHAFGALTDFSKACENAGITVCHQYDIEGDDWIWYWTKVLNAQGTNCVIWSIDNDLRQLVSNGDAMTVWYCERGGKNVMSFHKSLEEQPVDMDDLDFFMRPPVCKPDLVESLENITSLITYTNPNDVILEKIICGDKGDNIMSVARVVSNGRTYGVGPKIWSTIRQQCGINTINDLLQNIDVVAENIHSIKKFSVVKLDDIREMIHYNIRLVWLDEMVIPETIVGVMNQTEYLHPDMSFIRGAYTTLTGTKSEAEKAFENIPDCPF